MTCRDCDHFDEWGCEIKGRCRRTGYVVRSLAICTLPPEPTDEESGDD
jgi:hypothetical protein